MVKRFFLAAAVLVFAVCCAAADLPWVQDTEGQRQLKQYIDRVNECLAESGEQQINSLFEIYPMFAVLGITTADQAETPEDVEITVNLFSNTINSLELRVSNPERFAVVAEAMIRALTRDEQAELAVRTVKDRVQRAKKNPEQSYEDDVEELNGTKPYIYYAYCPNQYSDGVNWFQMTIIFPLSGNWDGTELGNGASATRGPDLYSDHDEAYEGYYSSDDYSHFDLFTTPTPEPDSAAGSPFFVP